MHQAHPDFTSTQNAEGGWIFLIAGDRLSGLHSADGFLRALAAGTLDIWPKLSHRRALYALAEPDGSIRAACAFALFFDHDGQPPRRLDLPLRELALRGEDGPDLGWGPVRLACAARCPRPEFRSQLWGERTLDVLPALVEAQRRLGERTGQRRRARTGAGSASTADVAQAAEAVRASFGEAGVLAPEQLAHGRRIAQADANDTFQALYTGEEVQRLRAADKQAIAALKRDLVMLRRRLNAAAE